MLQSFSVQPQLRSSLQTSQELLCNKCKQKPQEFILLLCDHIICGHCLNMVNSIKGEYGFDGVRCTCGVITYFNTEKFDRNDQNENQNDEENEGEESYIDRLSHKYGVEVKIHPKNPHAHEKQSRNGPTRYSVGLIKSKQTASTKNMSRLYTESFCNEGRGDRLMLERSNYPVEGDFLEEVDSSRMLVKKQKEQKRVSQNRLVKSKNLLHSDKIEVDQDSLIDEIETEKENANPNKRKTQHKHKNRFHNQNVEESNSEEEPEINMSKIKKGNIVSEELKSEILFLQAQHKKLLETLNRTYNHALTKINDDFTKLESSLKDLCLEKILLENNDSHVDIGKIVKLRYDGYIASNLQKLILEIKKFNLPDNNTNIRGLSNKLESQIEMPQFERRDGISRFSSPQSFCKSHILPEPVSIYSPKTHKYFGSSPKEIPPWIQNNSFTCDPSLTVKNSSHYVQNGHKLHKKTVRHRTNVIIEL